MVHINLLLEIWCGLKIHVAHTNSYLELVCTLKNCFMIEHGPDQCGYDIWQRSPKK